MRGLYVNCDGCDIPASINLAKKYSKTFVFPEEIGKGQVIYSPTEWPHEPYYSYNGHTFVATGWFIYEGAKNNLALLAKDIIEQGYQVLNNVEAGTFLIYWWDGEQAQVLVDPMGLSTHFIDLRSEQLKVAPSVKVLFNSNIHQINPVQQSILNKKQHLFGDYTLYEGIERLSPGSVYSLSDKKNYFELAPELCKPMENIGEEIGKLASYWNKDIRLLPISSGLDSRFILANTEFDHGFTYGPKDSPELNIAGKFADDFEEYYAYDFGEPALYKDEMEVNQEMSFGVLKPIERLLANYVHVREKFKTVSAFFDGYCGDVFQRGTFINYKGIEGELFKIFPWVYKLLKWDARKILRKRHSVLTAEEFSLVYEDFLDKTENLALDVRQKITYYEFLYGRGGRYAVFGSNILSAQLFTVVSPFAQRIVFNTVIHQDFYDSIKYKTMKKLWSKMPEKYRREKVESGYKPASNTLLIPFIQIVYRLMFHLIPSRANYGVQQRRLQKAKEKQ